MRRRIGFALAGVVVLGIGFSVPAHSATNAPDDKGPEIERLRDYELTAEERVQEIAQLAEEQDRIAYGEIAVPAVSPGHGISENGDVILRVYPGIDVEGVERALEIEGLKATILPSAYMPAEKEALEAALTSIKLDEGEAFGFAYNAVKDVVVVSGAVPQSKIDEAVGSRLHYEFEYGETAGRVSRLSDGVPHYGGATFAVWSSRRDPGMAT
jgi:hypothetical protein